MLYIAWNERFIMQEIIIYKINDYKLNDQINEQ